MFTIYEALLEMAEFKNQEFKKEKKQIVELVSPYLPIEIRNEISML